METETLATGQECQLEEIERAVNDEDLALIKDLEKRSEAVYIACHKDVAKDISEVLRKAAKRIRELKNQILQGGGRC